MIKSKYKKILLVCLIIVFVLMSVGTAILAGDVFHTQHCDVPNCSLCALIQIATSYSKDIINVIISILILNICIPLIYLIHQNKNEFSKQTLVKLKVIQIK